jgi:hypothetical protein
MKQFNSVICFIVTISGLTLGAPLDGTTGDCPGGLINGALLERGSFYYQCRDSMIVPKGCITDELKHIEIGTTVDKKRHRLQCVLGSDGVLSFELVSCLHEGAAHKIGEQWEDSKNLYTCKKLDNGDVRSITSGCIDQGKRVSLNEKVNKEDFVFICNETANNGARLMPSECVKDGRVINVGDSFEAGNAWSTCTRIGRERIAAKVMGCVNNGKRLNDGDRYFENDIIYECNINDGKIEVRTVGCAEHDERGAVVERRLGCTWVGGQGPFQYEWACRYDEAKKTANKVQITCHYKVGNGEYVITPGCFRIVDKTAVGCQQESSSLKLQLFQGDKAEQTASSAGLHAC